MKRNNANPNYLSFTGRTEYACYREAEIEEYCGNPLIEALPPILSKAEAIDQMVRTNYIKDKDRSLPPHIRLHLLERANRFFEPLPNHIQLEQRFSILLRQGYISRNPFRRGYWKEVDEKLDKLEEALDSKRNILDPGSFVDTELGFALIGISGIGKTEAFKAILLLYPQVIIHSDYKGRNFTYVQIAWLILQCPANRSLKSLCLAFFKAVDSLIGTHYFEDKANKGRVSANHLLIEMANVSAIHSIGTLIIEEVQNLAKGSSGGDEVMLSTFVELVNTLGMPIILVGTYKALPLLSRELRMARRSMGVGGKLWRPLEEGSVAWSTLLNSLWQYQCTAQPFALTPELSHALFYESAGITDLVVKAFVEAQGYAINEEIETVTPEILHKVAVERFEVLQPYLAALRIAKEEALASFDDIYPKFVEIYNPGYWNSESNFPLTSIRPVTDQSKEQPTNEEVDSEGGNPPNLSRPSTPSNPTLADPNLSPKPSGEVEKEQKPSQKPNSKPGSRSKPKKKREDDLSQIVSNGRKQSKNEHQALSQVQESVIMSATQFLENRKENVL